MIAFPGLGFSADGSPRLGMMTSQYFTSVPTTNQIGTAINTVAM